MTALGREPSTATAGRVDGLRLWVASVRMVWWRGNIRTVRLPGLLVTVAFFPTFFLVAFSGLFPRLADIPGYPTDSFIDFLAPFTLAQAAAFSGMGAGFAVGLDATNGFLDRLLVMPAHRSAIVVGTVLMSLTRALGVGIPVFVLALVLGVDLQGGILGIISLLVAATGLSAMASLFAIGVMLRFRDLRITAVFQIVIFVVLFTSTAQVPIEVMTGWIETAARWNPITPVLALARQATLPSGWSWGDTWPGLAVIIGSVAGLGWFAVRGVDAAAR